MRDRDALLMKLVLFLYSSGTAPIHCSSSQKLAWLCPPPITHMAGVARNPRLLIVLTADPYGKLFCVLRESNLTSFPFWYAPLSISDIPRGTSYFAQVAWHKEGWNHGNHGSVNRSFGMDMSNAETSLLQTFIGARC